MSDIPHFSARQYISAIRSLKISDGQRAMLKAHAEAPGRRLSTMQLARAAGAGRPQRTYVAYGRLGHTLALILEPRTRTLAGNERIWTRYLGDDERDPKTNALVWTLKPGVAKALIRLGWASASEGKQEQAKRRHARTNPFLFVTGSERKPERVRGTREIEWSCSKSVQPGDSVFRVPHRKGHLPRMGNNGTGQAEPQVGILLRRQVRRGH